jgi:hypothetical protein
MADSVAVLAEGLNDQIDVYHGGESTRAGYSGVSAIAQNFE